MTSMGTLRPGAKPVGKPMTTAQAQVMALNRIGQALERLASATERKAAALEAGVASENQRADTAADMARTFEAMATGNVPRPKA